MGMVLNWQCAKCGKKLPKIILPVVCSCGTITCLDGAIIFGPDLKLNNGSELWLELHNYKYTTAEEAKIWLKQWEAKLKCGVCKTHWAKLMENKENQPIFSSAYEFFLWGFNIHNIVNISLGKPIMSLEEAKKVYNIISSS